MAAAQGTNLSKHNSQQSHSLNAATTYPCGCSQEHFYVETTNQTVKMAESDRNLSALMSLIGGLLHPAAGVALGVATAIALSVTGHEVDYVDLCQTKYFVHGAYASDMNCYHVFAQEYNYTSAGTKDVKYSYWKYYSEFV